MRTTKLTLILSCLSVPAVAQDTPVASVGKEDETGYTLLVGSDYVSGEVSAEKYETVSINAGIAGRSGRFSLAASIPYVITSAPEDLIVSNGGLLGTPLLSQPSTQTRQVTREGIGDLVVQGGYDFHIGSVNSFIAGNIKIPTASREKALGSGELDYGLSGQLSRRFGEIIPFVGASYTIIGEPDGFDVQNTLSGSAGSHIVFGSSTSATLSYNYENSAVDTIANHQSVGVGFDSSVSSQLRVGLDARAGLSEDAPDARVGIRLSLGL